jgi:hypothetical protein
MKKQIIIFVLFCAFLVLFNNNLSIQSKTQQYSEQQSTQNIKSDDFRNMWWLKAAYYDSLEKGVTPYNAAVAYKGVAAIYFYSDYVWVFWNFNENWKTKYIQRNNYEFDVLDPSGDGSVDFPVRIQRDNADTFLLIYNNFFTKKWERFKKYPQKYWFTPPPVGLINDVFFKGKYRRLYPLGSEIEFTINGKITGIDNYTDFEVGYCTEGGPPKFDCIMFKRIDSVNNRIIYNYNNDLYHWKFNDDTLELYPVITTYSNPDSLGPLRWKLLRISR